MFHVLGSEKAKSGQALGGCDFLHGVGARSQLLAKERASSPTVYESLQFLPNERLKKRKLLL